MKDWKGKKMINPKPGVFIILLTAYCLLPTMVDAGEKNITLEEAYRMAVATHEAVRIAREDLFQAEKNVDKALSVILPTITAEGDYTRYSEEKRAGGFLIQPEDSTRFELKINQPLYSGGKEWSARRQAKMTVEEKKIGLEVSREKIILDTAKAYFGVLKAEKEVEIKEAALKRAKEIRDVASSRFRVGEVTKSVVLRAEAEVAGAEAELTKATRRLIDEKNVLKRLIGVQDDINLVEPPLKSPLDADVEGLVSRSLEVRRDYRQSIIFQEIASEGIRYAKGNFLPSLRVEGVYSWRDQDPQTTFFQEETVYGTLTITFPLFEGGLRRAELAEARSRLRETELRRLNLKRDIEVEVKEAFNNMETVNAVIESYKKQVSFAEENYNMVFKQFKYGLATNVDVIDADTTLISAQRELMNATYDLQIAMLELKKKVGILLDEVEGGR